MYCCVNNLIQALILTTCLENITCKPGIVVNSSAQEAEAGDGEYKASLIYSGSSMFTRSA